MTQIEGGITLAWFHVRALAEGFHIPPRYLTGSTACPSGGEYRSGGLFLLLKVFPQQPA